MHGRGVSDALAAHQRPSPAGIHVDVDHLHIPLNGHAGRFIKDFGDLLQIRVGNLLNLHVVFYIDHIGDAADFICHGIPQRFRILYDISAVDQRVEKPACRTRIDLQRLADIQQPHRTSAGGQIFHNTQCLFCGLVGHNCIFISFHNHIPYFLTFCIYYIQSSVNVNNQNSFSITSVSHPLFRLSAPAAVRNVEIFNTLSGGRLFMLPARAGTENGGIV